MLHVPPLELDTYSVFNVLVEMSSGKSTRLEIQINYVWLHISFPEICAILLPILHKIISKVP